VYVTPASNVITAADTEHNHVPQVHPAVPVNLIVVPNIESVIALNGELSCNIPAGKTSELIVDGVDNEPDSEYTIVEAVLVYPNLTTDVNAYVIAPDVCVHVYVVAPGIFNINEVDIKFTDPAPVLLNEMFLI
jgi:hypothetical protein